MKITLRLPPNGYRKVFVDVWDNDGKYLCPGNGPYAADEWEIIDMNLIIYEKIGNEPRQIKCMWPLLGNEFRRTNY
jgi:hypothetical protein